jgi:hypothetical protein
MATLLQTKAFDLSGRNSPDVLAARVRRTCSALRDAIARRRLFEAKVYTVAVAWNETPDQSRVVPVTVLPHSVEPLETTQVATMVGNVFNE